MQATWNAMMKPLATALLAIALLPAQFLLAQPAKQRGSVVRQCGRERWEQKILSDDDTAMINFSRATLTSIGNLGQMPTVVADEFMPRQPYERNIYSVDALLCGYRLDNDGNFRLYLRDPATDRTMPALIPDPDCPEIAATPHAASYRATRQWIRATVGPPADSLGLPMLVAVTGVGLYEALNHEQWRAENRLALHPVIGLQPIESPRLVEQPAIAAAAKKPKKGGTKGRTELAAATAPQQQTSNQNPTQNVAKKTERKQSYRRTGNRKKKKKFRRHRIAVSPKQR